jgi:hypothetical protein
MNRRAVACALALTGAALAAPAFAAAPPSGDNTMGVWNRNMVTSNYPTDPMASLVMERTPIPGGVHIHCTGKFKTGGLIDYTVDVLYDGKDYPSHGIGASYATLSITPIDANHQLSTSKRDRYFMNGRTEVTPDGKHMIITQEGSFATGAPGGFKIIWDKQ